MKAPVDFYFDFSSPYGYLASQKIEALAAKHGRGVTWRPMLLGAAFKATGAAAAAEHSAQGRVREARLPALGALPRRAVPHSRPIPDLDAARLPRFLCRPPIARKP